MQSPQNTVEKILEIVEKTQIAVEKTQAAVNKTQGDIMELTAVVAQNTVDIQKNTSSIHDLTDILNAFVLHTEERFQKMDVRIDRLEEHTNRNFANLQYQVSSLQNQSVSKAYLDQKFSTFRNELIEYLHRNYGPPKHFSRTVQI